jgi:hypothetical protein
LPPCRYRPAEAGRRSDSVKLRSAEADPHVTEREVPHAAEATRGQPRRTSATGAVPTCANAGRAEVGREIGPGPGWVHPEQSARPLGGARRRRRGDPRPRPRVVPRGSIATAEADGMRVRRTIAERIGFEALLRRQSPLSSGRRCRRPTLVPSMGFVPLRGPSCSPCPQQHRGEAVSLAAPW